MKIIILIFILSLTSFAQSLRFTGNEISIGYGMSFSGQFVEATAGDTLYFNETTFLYQSKMYKCDETVDSTVSGVIYLCVSDSLLINKIGRFLYSGFAKDTSWTHTAGSDVCITSGAADQAACNTKIGTSIDTVTIAFFANDSRVAKGIGGSFSVTGRLRQDSIWHVYGGFQDSSITIDVLDEDWTEITNASNNLWGGTEAEGFTISGDTMTVVNGGDYTGSVSITFAALTNKDYHFRIYNVTQTAQVGFHTGASTTGATNFTNINLPIYLEATAGDELVLQVYGVSDGTDITVEHGTFFITYLHD